MIAPIREIKKVYLPTLAVICLVLVLSGVVLAEEPAWRYPDCLLDAYDADSNGWEGIGPQGNWPVPVVPEQLLVGPPLSQQSAVTLSTDHWVELKFQGKIVDGPGYDLLLIEVGAAGEQANVYLTDTAQQAYLLGVATAGTSGVGDTEIGFDISGISLSFVPSAVRILGLDEGGAMPGFDLNCVYARTYISYGNVACNPSPADNAESVAPDVKLSWTPGDCAEKHTVYFGATLNDVNESAVPVSNPAQPQEANSYDPGTLEIGWTYYWRVDEVNSHDTNSPWAGRVWSFTVSCLVVDDFDDYNDSSPGAVYDTWDDGWIIPHSSGSAINVSTTITPAGPTHQASTKSLIYWYDNDGTYSLYVGSGFSPYYSEIEAAVTDPGGGRGWLQIGSDWTKDNVQALVLYFYGDPNNDVNDTEQMYVALEDGGGKTAVVKYDANSVSTYNGGMQNLKIAQWQRWSIDLQDFKSPAQPGANDVNLADIAKVYIGFGDRYDHTQLGGEGCVFFDDVSLYIPRCLAEYGPAADFTGDCTVGLEDLELMADCWLDSNYTIATVEPDNNGLLLHYRFDEISGTIAADSAGDVNGILTEFWGTDHWVSGKFCNALTFDGSNDWVDINDNALTDFHDRTICVWVKSHPCKCFERNGFIFGTDSPYYVNIRITTDGTINAQVGDGNDPYFADTPTQQETWYHVALVIHDTVDGKCTARLYVDGALKGSAPGIPRHYGLLEGANIGSLADGNSDFLSAAVDDFRIYGYPLSENEIAYLASDGDAQLYVPLPYPQVDISANGSINFEDYTQLADSWLDNQLWP